MRNLPFFTGCADLIYSAFAGKQKRKTLLAQPGYFVTDFGSGHFYLCSPVSL